MSMKTKLAAALATTALAAAVLSFSVPTHADDTKKDEKKPESSGGVDPAIKSYEVQSGISGNLSSVGSDTLNNLMAYWVEGFNKHYPNVKTSVKGEGSGSAPPALTDGKADLGPMSRPMKGDEIEKFEKKFGYKPTPIKVAVDALAVYVHKDNPIEKLTMPQVDAIFSKNRLGKHPTDVTKWGEAGLKGAAWENLGITLYGRNSNSGTYGYFKEHALYKGDFKATVKEQPGSSTVVQLVGEDMGGIGYSGIGYKTASVRAVPLAKDDKSAAFEATAENCYSGKYPLSRYLLVYVNKPQGKPLSPVVREFLLFIQSKEGQEITVKDGFIPMRKADIDAQEKVIKG